MRRWRRWILAFAILLALPAVLLLWLLLSGSARDWSLARVVAALPPDALQIGAAEGRLLGPLVLRDLHYRGDGFSLSVDRLEMDHALRGLAGGSLWIRHLRIGRLRIELDAPAEPAAATPTRLQLPAQLPWPTLALPIDLALAELKIEQLDVWRDGQPVLPASALTLRDAELDRIALRIAALDLGNERGRLTLAGSLGVAGEPRADMTAGWTFAGESVTAASLTVDGQAMGLRLGLELAEAGGLQLSLDRAMAWRLAADIRELDSQRWLPDSAPQRWTLKLDGHGDGTRAELAGHVAVDDQRLGIEALQAELIEDGGALQLASLRLLAPAGGTVSSRGRVAFADKLHLELVSEIEQLVIPAGDPAEAVLRLDGTLLSKGPPNALQLELRDGALQRGELLASLALAGELSEDSLRIDDLRLQHSSGEVDVAGVIGWQPVFRGELGLQLRDFDPALLWPAWPGKISGALRVVGQDDPVAPQLEVELSELAGDLRGRALRGGGRLELGAAVGALDLDIALGDSRLSLTGDPRDPLDINLQLAPLALADLLPGGDGRLSATLRVSGARSAPRVTGTASGEDLSAEGWTIGSFEVDIDAPVDGAGAGQVALQGRAIRYQDTVVDSLMLRLEGGRERHALTLALESERGALQLAASGAARGEDWSGRVDALTLAPQALPAWTLAEPADLAWRGGKAELQPACLQSAGGGQLCLQAGQQDSLQQASLQLNGLGLQTIVLALGIDGVQLDGLVEADLSLQRRADAPVEGRLALRLPTGTLAQTEVEGRPLLRWDAISLDGELAADALTLRLSGRLDDTGSIVGEFSGGSPLADPDAEVSGSVQLSMPGIGALELALPDLANLRGTVQANLAAQGRWRDPRLSGSISLDALTAEVPALGLRVRDSRLRLDSENQGLKIDGLIDTGAGKLLIEGALADAFGVEAVGSLTLRGDTVLVADTERLRARVTPDLQLRLSKGRLRLTGTVAVPEAAIALEQLDGSVAASSDVVVLDPREGGTRSSPLALQTRIEVELGNKVTLKGFGFDGGISGRLAINERGGQSATARGSLSVRGRYRAYGQDLEIQRGRLLFASSPLDNPALDVRAQRKIDDVTVGIEVSGSALQPQLVVWSDPALDQAEALSYLVLGRPLRSATAADGAQLGQAAAAIGGNLLAGRLGARLGFDTFGVADSQALGGAAFTVGKYLSPALYLSYGVSLFGSGQVITLRYLLSERFDIEIESGSESRAGLNYSVER